VREKGALCLWRGGEACEPHQFGSKPLERGRRSSPERGGTTTSSSIGSRGGRWSGRGRCGEIRGSGRSFYRCPGRGEEEVASTDEACCGGNDGAQWWRRDGSGQAVVTRRLGHSVRGRKAPIHASERVNGEETVRAVASDERVDG
jgi:hypothetical protein